MQDLLLTLGITLIGDQGTTCQPRENLLPQVKGSLLETIKYFEKTITPKDSHAYSPPNPEELVLAQAIAQHLMDNDVYQALTLSKPSPYLLVRWLDVTNNLDLYRLSEKPVKRNSPRGWGQYFLNPKARLNLLIEAPHPLFDQGTPALATQLFMTAQGRGLLIAGAHRHSNGYQSADVCRLETSVFQTVHQAWLKGTALTLQLHGFQGKKHWVSGLTSEIILSRGDGAASDTLIYLHQYLLGQGFRVYLHAPLATEKLSRFHVDPTTYGQAFSELSGSRNQQGLASRQAHRDFIHMEVEHNLRVDPVQSQRLVKASVQSLQSNLLLKLAGEKIP